MFMDGLLNRTNLHEYQEYSVRFIIDHPTAAILLDCGLGKTVITLTALNELLFDYFEMHKVLVICPLRVGNVWKNEVQKWSHIRNLKLSVAIGTETERLAALKTPADIYHRIEPSIWVTYMNEIKFPIKEKHAIIAGPRPGRMWDSLKIGAGAQPIKTKHGWLLIYHGVDYNYVYSLGVILVDLNNPEKVIYRSPNPILEPEEEYEIGLSGAWVPNVVFTCGAVGAEDKEVLDDDDKVLVYYGAADTSIGVATATVAELIPEEFRVK
jgi:predicted GH43/DUF377 family glycosyl hydrolase